MNEFFSAIIATIMVLLSTNAIIYGILGIFCKNKKPKVIAVTIVSLIIIYTMLFKMDDLNTFGAVIGIIATGIIAYNIFVGKGNGNGSENNEK